LLRDEQLHSWSLDPDIQFGAHGTIANEEPLLVNLIDTWKLRPDAVTKIPNLFLASDYVRTFTDLATMEAANEAARRAVNGILDRAGSDAPRCGVWQLHEPEIFAPWRELDYVRYAQGLPWDDTLVRVGLSFADLVHRAIAAIEGVSEEQDVYSPDAARSSSPLRSMFAAIDRQDQSHMVSDLRRDATTLVERIMRVLAIRMVETQTRGAVPAAGRSSAGRVRIVPQ
jgi:hypothetical protein